MEEDKLYAVIDGRTIFSEHSDEDILQTSAAMVGKDFYLNQIEIRKDIIKQQKSYWDVTITYELNLSAFNHTSRRKWTFTSNDTSASILSVLGMALPEFDVLRYDFLRVGFKLRFIDLNIKLIEK